MKKKILSVVLASVMILCMLNVMVPAQLSVKAQTTSTYPTMPTTEVNLNLSELTADVTTDDYQVTSAYILLKNRDVTYILSGSTTKNIKFANNPNDYTGKVFSVVLNGVTCGNIEQGNNKTWTINIQLAAGTTNVTGTVVLRDLCLFGTGTLKPSLLANSSAAKLTITDAKVTVEGSTKSAWDGTVLINGNADVKLIADDNYDALKIGEQSKSTLTLDGNATLTLTHKNPNDSTAYPVHGLSLFKGSMLEAKGNSTLAAYAKKSTGSYSGAGIIAYGYDDEGNIKGTVKISEKAQVTAVAYNYFAIVAVDFIMNGGTLNATADDYNALYAADSLSLTDAILKLTNSSDFYNLACLNAFTVYGCWLDASTNAFPTNMTANNSVLIADKSGKVVGDMVLPADVTLPAGYTMEIGTDASLTVPQGVTFTNHGEFTIYGTFTNNGTVVCDCHCNLIDTDILYTGKENATYWKVCRLCGNIADRKAIPDVEVQWSSYTCPNKNFPVTIIVPDGVTVKVSAVFNDDAENPILLTPTVAEGGFKVEIPGDKLPVGTLVELSVDFKTADGFDMSRICIFFVDDDHTGGTATCIKKAVCENCGDEYGEIDVDNHESLNHIEAEAATVTETGNTEYWYCEDCKKYFADEAGKTEIKAENTLLAKLSPEIIEGKGQSVTVGDKTTLTFRSNAAYSDFIMVGIDGKEVNENNYTKKEGSTIITLNAEYVSKLAVGEHTLGIVSQSGTATTTFTINAAKQVDNNNQTTSPKTGDNGCITLWIASLFVSGGMITVTECFKKRKAFDK